MPGLIERYNGQHIVSLTANIHGMTLGEAAAKLNQALAAAGAPPRGVSSGCEGEIPPLEQTISGLRTGLLLAVLAIFLLLCGEFPVDAAGARHRSDHSRGAVRRAADATAHAHHAKHPILHGRDHGDRNRGGELDFAGHLRRARPARRHSTCSKRRGKARPAGCEPS